MNSANSFTVLLISHVNPALRSEGNEIRILKMINWLRAEGAKVVLLLNQPLLSTERRSQLLEIVDAVYTPDECPVSLARKIKNAANRFYFRPPVPATKSEQMRAYLGSKYLIQATGILCKRYRPQAVIAEYVFATPCLREVPSDVVKFVDTHDLLSKRDPKESIYCSPEVERNYLLDADVVIAIQPNEADQFRALVPERRVVTVGIDYNIFDNNNNDGMSKNTVLVVGSNNANNILGLHAFCEHAWPLIRKENPRAELVVAGKIGEALSDNMAQVKVLGWVDNLLDLYRDAAVVINPTITGTGLKIKTVEALCNGKPLVATPNAVEGFDFDGEAPCMVCDNWREFAGAVVSLLASDERRFSFQDSALRFARERFAASKVYAQLAVILRNHMN